MKLGRFIIDTHVHAQRHAAGPELKKVAGGATPRKFKYEDFDKVMGGITTYDNSGRLLYDMDCYGVDMAIIMPAFGMSNELNVQLVEKYPNRFVALCTYKVGLRIEGSITHRDLSIGQEGNGVEFNQHVWFR
jgi:hypothetical protein